MKNSLKLLAIETATESCSAALLLGNDIFSISEIAPRRHNEIILPMCEQVLAQGQIKLSQLDAIAFGRGPGAFTGVRLAASVTQGIALAHDLPVVPVSSLAAMAQAAYDSKQAKQVLSCIDARMQEVYIGLYQLDQEEVMQIIVEEQVIKPELIEIDISNDCVGIGSGWVNYAMTIQEKCGAEISYDAQAFPQAEFVAKLANYYFQQGRTVSAIEALPVYLRDNVATKPKQKKYF